MEDDKTKKETVEPTDEGTKEKKEEPTSQKRDHSKHRSGVGEVRLYHHIVEA